MIHYATGLVRSQKWGAADRLTGHDLLPILRHTRLLVSSWSMFPTIRKGDYIELDHACEVNVGDIVVYRQCGALVCHRVRSLTQDGLVITGSEDMATGTDAVFRRDIIGRVTWIIRGRRRFAPAHGMPPTLMACLRRRFDQYRASYSNKARSIAAAILAGLTRRRIPHRLLSRLFLSCLRFRIMAKMPIESIPAYDLADNPIWSHGTRRTSIRVRKIATRERLIVCAYLGSHLVGSVDLRSGEQRLHPLIGGLGLELYFAELTHLQ